MSLKPDTPAVVGRKATASTVASDSGTIRQPINSAEALSSLPPVQSEPVDADPAILHMGFQHVFLLVQLMDFLREHYALFHIFSGHKFPDLFLTLLLYRLNDFHLGFKLRNRLR